MEGMGELSTALADVIKKDNAEGSAVTPLEETANEMSVPIDKEVTDTCNKSTVLTVMGAAETTTTVKPIDVTDVKNSSAPPLDGSDASATRPSPIVEERPVLVEFPQESKTEVKEAPMPLPHVPEKSADSRKDDEYLLLLGHYLQSIRNKDAHAKFLEDSVVGPFLSLCLASNSDKVLVGVLKIVNVLLKNRDNYLRLKELLHFTDALSAASRNERLHTAIRNKAATFYDVISSAKKPLGNNFDSSNAEASLEIGKPIATAREVHFYINHSLQKTRRVIITRALVKIEGVISVAYNPDQQLCVVRARRVRPEVLGTAVANLGLECYLLAKNEKREGVRILMKSDSHTNQGNDENKQEPFYFPEEDDEVVPADNAVAKKGFNENEDGEGWWNSAKKLARKSLFW